MVEKLKKMNEDLFIYESSLTPEEWKLTSERWAITDIQPATLLHIYLKCRICSPILVTCEMAHPRMYGRLADFVL